MKGTSSYSFDGTKLDQPDGGPPPLDETDDVPDIPIPVAEYPDSEDKPEVSIPMVDMTRAAAEAQVDPRQRQRSVERSQGESQEYDSDTTPLSPHVVVHTKTKSKSTFV